MDNVIASVGLGQYSTADIVYTKMVMDEGLLYEYHHSWESDEVYAPSGTVVWEQIGSPRRSSLKWSTIKGMIRANMVDMLRRSDHSIIYRPSGNGNTKTMLVYVSRSRNGHFSVRVSGINRDAAAAHLADIRDQLPERPPEGDGKIGVTFWHNSDNGAVSHHRSITAPTWDSIESNYVRSTREALTKLVSFEPKHSGQIFLWHGPPGTGKTYALRSLIHAWKSWCSAEFILDPEKMFGQDAGYMMDMLLSGDGEDEDEGPVKSDWKLLIMEDTGELISQTAKTETGQGLSRLLNVTDGFIGQGLKVLVLITTNELVEKLHPAVARPGRAAAIVEFGEMTPADIRRWAEVNGHDASLLPHKSSVLADLYAAIDGSVVRTDLPHPVGFRKPEESPVHAATGWDGRR